MSVGSRHFLLFGCVLDSFCQTIRCFLGKCAANAQALSDVNSLASICVGNDVARCWLTLHDAT